MLRRRLHRKAREFAIRRIVRRRPPPIVEAVRAERLSYLEEVALCDLFSAVRDIEAAGCPGRLIEAGCGLGGSAIVIASAKDAKRQFDVYDLFGMPPGATDGDGPDVHALYERIASGRQEGIGGDVFYGYRDDVYAECVANLERHGIATERGDVNLVCGLLQDTLEVQEPVALAHVDCDRYESVKTCLQRIAPRLVRGGRLIIDDYVAWSGCRNAVDEYFAGKRDEYRFAWLSRLHVVRR